MKTLFSITNSVPASSKITSFEEESGESSKILSSEQSSTSQAIEHESNQNESTESGTHLRIFLAGLLWKLES